MDGEILDVVTDWGTRSVADGVDGLYDLADADFSGAVTDGSAWAFLLNGRVVGVFDGDVDDFEDAPLTAYTAPDISLPLLFAMQAGGGETRGQYYSNETPLSEIDDTLSSGSFVGYVELSENVLSGDYYVVYYGGRSLPVAFVGNEPRLLTGDEAFDRAADEVGIYSVVDADVTVVDLPDRPDPEPTTAVGGAAAGGPDDVDEETDADRTPPAESADATDDADPIEGPEDVSIPGDGTPSSSADDGTTDAAADDGTTDAATDDGTTDAATDDGTTDAASVDDGAPTATDDATGTADDVDPDATATDGADATATDSDATGAEPTGEDAVAVAPEAEAEGADVDVAETGAVADAPDETDVAAAEAVDASVDTAPGDDELDAVRAARDDAEAERDEYRREVARLRDRIERLEAELDAATNPDAEPERTLDPEEALSGTNLFVRYDDGSGPTVDGAVAGEVSQEALRANLRVEYHTEFETAAVRIDGRPFEAFLRATTQHRFVEWLLTDLPFEIRRADASGVSKLYEAIGRIDRIDLDGEVRVEPRPDAADDGAAYAFDVVCRDKMGDPLFVADYSDSRDPTRASTIESILDRSTPIGERNASLAAAAVVTTSFFDADAMEATVDATRGGLFSRSSRRSYVKLSRNHGFHLCLIEARDEDVFLTVPEL
jgi:hypothetical protein